MKNFLVKTSALLCLVVCTSFSTDNDDVTPWKLEKSRNGIKVFSRIPEGESLKEIKMYATVHASLSCALSILMDVAHYSDWIYNCKVGKLVEKLNDQEMIYYSVSGAPWPMDDRDLVMQNKVYQNKKTKELYSVSVPLLNKLPVQPGKVRITNMYGKWKFTPKKDGLLLIEYYIKIDPGGTVPNWIINLVIDKGPYQTMVNFKETLKLDRYKNAKIEFIDEPTD